VDRPEAELLVDPQLVVEPPGEPAEEASRGTDEERMARSSGTRSRWAETRGRSPGRTRGRYPEEPLGRFGSPESDFP